MPFPELKCTFFSGTSLGNFRECAFVSEGKVFYKKSDPKFYSQRVYYTSKMPEAAYYAKAITHYPLIMAGRLSIFRLFILSPKSITIFPVDSIYISPKQI